jgi:hypothetical protein
MTQEEYQLKLNQLHSNLTESTYYEVRELKKEYSISNNKYKIGDIIDIGVLSMKITDIGYGFILAGSMDGYPQCLYKGIQLSNKTSPIDVGSITFIFEYQIPKN